MTVQFILPEATSFPKERKLHDRLFLVLLYNLLCKTFKDHSSTFAASLRSERNSLLQERCFPIASAKVGHFCIPCKTSPKKNARKNHLHPFCYFLAWQNRQLSPFFRFIPSLSFSPQNHPFSPESATFGAKTAFSEHFPLHLVRFSYPKSLFSSKKSVSRREFLPQSPQFRLLQARKRRKKAFFSPSPTPFEKYKPTFSPNVPTFRDFLPCFISNLPTPHKIHFTLRAGHAPTRIYALAHSANLPLLPSPFTSPRNKLYISRLRVKANPAFTFTFTTTT